MEHSLFLWEYQLSAGKAVYQTWHIFLWYKIRQDINCEICIRYKIGQDINCESKNVISWLTVSNQIVKSLSLSYKKFYFFNMVQPIDLIFCKMIEIIEQNIFNHADFLFRS